MTALAEGRQLESHGRNNNTPRLCYTAPHVLPHAGPVDRDLRPGGRGAGVRGAVRAGVFRSDLAWNGPG